MAERDSKNRAPARFLLRGDDGKENFINVFFGMGGYKVIFHGVNKDFPFWGKTVPLQKETGFFSQGFCFSYKGALKVHLQIKPFPENGFRKRR